MGAAEPRRRTHSVCVAVDRQRKCEFTSPKIPPPSTTASACLPGGPRTAASCGPAERNGGGQSGDPGTWGRTSWAPGPAQTRPRPGRQAHAPSRAAQEALSSGDTPARPDPAQRYPVPRCSSQRVTSSHRGRQTWRSLKTAAGASSERDFAAPRRRQAPLALACPLSSPRSARSYPVSHSAVPDRQVGRRTASAAARQGRRSAERSPSRKHPIPRNAPADREGKVVGQQTRTPLNRTMTGDTTRGVARN